MGVARGAGYLSADWRSPRSGRCLRRRKTSLTKERRWQGLVNREVAGKQGRSVGCNRTWGERWGVLWERMRSGDEGTVSCPCFFLSGEAFPRLVTPPAFFIIRKIHCRRPVPESLSSAFHALLRSSAFARRLPRGRPSTSTPHRAAPAPMTYCLSSGQGPNLKLLLQIFLVHGGYFWC